MKKINSFQNLTYNKYGKEKDASQEFRGTLKDNIKLSYNAKLPRNE